jgi:uncharacterized protein YegP (UPF0339 family)
MGKFVIEPIYNGEFHFKLVTDTGQTILVSEEYSTKIAASRMIKFVKSNVAIEEMLMKLTSCRGEPYFIMVSDGLRIGTSEMYESEAERDRGMSAVKRYAPDAEVEEC